MELGPERIGKMGATIILLTVIGAAGLAVRGYSATAAIGGSLVSTPGAAGPRGRAAGPRGRSPGSPPIRGQRSRANHAGGPLLRAQSYASSAYRVYPPPITAQAKVALSGITFHVAQRPSGMMTVSIHVSSNGGHLEQTYPSTDRVYIVETTTGDDSNGRDYNSGDDGFVVTSSTGHIVR